jgi:hypothetical protein
MSAARSRRERSEESCRTRHMTLSIGKYCAGAGFGFRGVAALVMAIPGCAVVTDVYGRERGSVRGGGGQPLSFRTS